MSVIDDLFLQLIRVGIGAETVWRVPANTNWELVKALADNQGLLAIVVDGVEQLPDGQRPPKEILLQWIGEVFQGYEYRYVQYISAILELARFYNSHEFKMMILKGYACGMEWPKPEHRPYGDIDIWQFGRQKEADALLESLKDQGVQKFKIDRSHHHHTVFYWEGFMVENHYDFINTKDLQSSRSIEIILKELGEDDRYYVELKDSLSNSLAKVYLPSPNLHALFLLRHLLLHFVSTSINLRQVLDWGFFVKAHSSEIDWKRLLTILDEYNMQVFFNCINAICIEELGFESYIFPHVRFYPDIKDQILCDILHPKYSEYEPNSFVPRLIYKYKRWKGNAWKQELCYKESRWCNFWMSLWAHFIKPSSILKQ